MSQENLNLVITGVVVPILTALAILLVNYINAKAEEVKAKMHNDEVKKYIDIANEAVCVAVGAVAQTMVDGLKKAAEDGVLSSEEASAAFNEAKAKSLAIMGVAGQEAVKELYADFDQWLAAKIEFYVGANKKGA